MLKSIGDFIKKIQNSDEKTKRRWLIGTSAVAMVIVIGLWLAYLKTAIRPVVQSETPSDVSIQFPQVFKAGLKSAWDGLKANAQKLFSKILGERTITIKQ